MTFFNNDQQAISQILGSQKTSGQSNYITEQHYNKIPDINNKITPVKVNNLNDILLRIETIRKCWNYYNIAVTKLLSEIDSVFNIYHNSRNAKALEPDFIKLETEINKVKTSMKELHNTLDSFISSDIKPAHITEEYSMEFYVNLDKCISILLLSIDRKDDSLEELLTSLKNKITKYSAASINGALSEYNKAMDNLKKANNGEPIDINTLKREPTFVVYRKNNYNNKRKKSPVTNNRVNR